MTRTVHDPQPDQIVVSRWIVFARLAAAGLDFDKGDDQQPGVRGTREVDRRATIAARCKAIHETLKTWTPEQMAHAGVVVTIGRDGDVEVMRGLVQCCILFRT